MHESRHKHAINRVRGDKGRFVNMEGQPQPPPGQPRTAQGPIESSNVTQNAVGGVVPIQHVLPHLPHALPGRGIATAASTSADANQSLAHRPSEVGNLSLEESSELNLFEAEPFDVDQALELFQDLCQGSASAHRV